MAYLGKPSNVPRRILLARTLAAAAGLHFFPLDEARTGLFLPEINVDSLRVERASSLGLEGLTEANRFLRKFPNKIPRARAVDKYETPGATQCLVHIRQAHHRFIGGKLAGVQDFRGKAKASGNEDVLRNVARVESAVRQVFDYMNSCQRDIAHILVLLKRDGIISGEFHAEGIARDYSFNELGREYEQRLNDVLDTGLFMEEQRQSDFGAYSFIPGACFVLGLNKQFKILPGATFDVFADDPRRKRKDWADIREDDALSIIAASNKPYAIFTYGGKHAFGGEESCGEKYCRGIRESTKDNLAANYPGRFSLIEITPARYIEYDFFKELMPSFPSN